MSLLLRRTSFIVQNNYHQNSIINMNVHFVLLTSDFVLCLTCQQSQKHNRQINIAAEHHPSCCLYIHFPVQPNALAN